MAEEKIEKISGKQSLPDDAQISEGKSPSDDAQKAKLSDKPKVSDKVEKTEAKPTVKSNKAVECNDNFCPFHGKSKLHGRSLKGEVLSTKAHKTASIVIKRQYFLKKYERYEKRRTKIQVHNPPCINAKAGDIVKIKESRPLSKTKHFIIIEVIEKK